jgi:sugar (pentulose or hexulose) kinase
VFGADVFQLEVGNSAALGAALRAFHADQLADGRKIPWDDVIAGFVEPLEDSRMTPDAPCHELYTRLIDAYAACEAHALGRGPDPEPLLRAARGPA